VPSTSGPSSLQGGGGGDGGGGGGGGYGSSSSIAWKRGLPEKATKKSPTSYGTRRFITAFTTARLLYLF
jgi:hypothetical protein